MIPGPPFRGILSPPCKIVNLSDKQNIMGTHGNVNNVDNKIRKLARIIRGEVIAAAFDEKHLAIKFRLKCFQGADVGGDVLADGGVGTAAGFDCEDAFGGECAVFD